MLEALVGILIFLLGVIVGIIGDILYERNYSKGQEPEAKYLTDDKNFYSTDRAIAMMSVKDTDRE